MLKSSLTVGLNTLASRILGLVRDVVIATSFGASAGIDAFLVAFRIPNFLRRLFAEGAFSQAFVPVLSEYKTTRGHEDVRNLAAHVFGALGGALFLVTLIGVVGAPVLVTIFAPGFIGEGEKFPLTVEMVHITFPYLLFVSLTSFAGGMLNSYGRFGVPAITPVLLNLSLIGAAFWLAPRFSEPVVALAWGVLIAGVIQLAFQIPFLYRLRLLVAPRFKRGHEGVARVFKLILPAVFGVSVSQINLLVDTLIASFLVTGSVTWLYYSDRLLEFPLGVFGIALATVILPNLSRQHAEGSTEDFSNTIDWALRLTLAIAIPAALGLAVLAVPLLTTLFQYRAFGPGDVHMASLSLMAYSLGLAGFIGIKILAPGFYARQDMRTPVRIAVVAMLSNIVLNLTLVVPLAHAGLALATSLSAFINAGLLYRALRRDGIYRPRAGWLGFGLRVLLASLAMLAALLWFKGDPDGWFAAELGERISRLALLIVLGVMSYFGVLAALGMKVRALLGPGRAG